MPTETAARPRCRLTDLFLARAEGRVGATAEFWEALQVEVARGLRREIRRRGVRISAADVDDLEQELLIDVWQIDLERFDPARGTLGAFITRRVQWKLIDHLRRLGRHRHESLDARADAGLAEPGTSETRPDHLHDETRRELTLLSLAGAAREVLSALKDPAAACALLRHDLDGVPLREVARELGVHPSSATRARQRALVGLQNGLSSEFALAA